jgi:hypothetical protein
VNIFFVLPKQFWWSGNGIVGAGRRVVRKPLSGQYRLNLDTGHIYIVGSQASEHPNLEKQASLLQWGEDKVKLERWVKDAAVKG